MSKQEYPTTTLPDQLHLIAPPPLPPPHLPQITPSATTVAREYRKGNWTLHETLILIAAKKLDDERRLKAAAAAAASSSAQPSSSSSPSQGRGGEPRWKWVENYCYSRGCLRSQNQCNDKWDNLLRDYKKVRDYDYSMSTTTPPPSSSFQFSTPSYWTMDKQQRKLRNLPSNLAPELFHSLNDVVLPKRTPSSTPQAPPPLPPPPPPPSQLPPVEAVASSPVTGSCSFPLELFNFYS